MKDFGKEKHEDPRRFIIFLITRVFLLFTFMFTLNIVMDQTCIMCKIHDLGCWLYLGDEYYVSLLNFIFLLSFHDCSSINSYLCEIYILISYQS